MVVALVGLIFILLLVFVLIIRGQSKKYAKKTDSGELAPSLLEGRAFPCPPPFRRGGWSCLSRKCTCSHRWSSLGFLPSLHLLVWFQL